MLSEFYIAVEDFQAELKDCGQGLAEYVGINHIQRHRMSDLGQDMISFCECFARAHINATMWVSDDVHEMNRRLSPNPPDWQDIHKFLSGNQQLDQQTQDKVQAHLDESQKGLDRMVRRQKSQAAKRSEESMRELKASYKAYFFFIRAFHDASYGVLLNLNGLNPGKYSSMNKCITKQNDIYKQIDLIPGYVDWFKAFKKKRDLVKGGVNFSLCGPQWDVGVGFNKITQDGGLVVSADMNEGKVRIGDLTSAFRFSFAIVKLISEIRAKSVQNQDAET